MQRDGTGPRVQLWSCRTPACASRDRSPAIDEMNTIVLPAVMRERGPAQQEVRAHVDGGHEVPLLHRCLRQPGTLADPDVADQPVDPTQRTNDSSTIRSHADSSTTSPTTTGADAPSASTSRAVSSAARASRSTHAMIAPSLAASTAIARPLPTGASGSSDAGSAPTTTMRRPARRWVTVRMLPEVGSPPPAAPRSNVGELSREDPWPLPKRYGTPCSNASPITRSAPTPTRCSRSRRRTACR